MGKNKSDEVLTSLTGSSELELGVYRHIHICAAYATRVVTSEMLWMYHMKIIFLIIAANQDIGWDFILRQNQLEERLALE